MPTKKARLNLSLSKALRGALHEAARRDHVPQATKAARLLEAALELEEDQVWDDIASRRDTKNTRYLPHDKAWK